MIARRAAALLAPLAVVLAAAGPARASLVYTKNLASVRYSPSVWRAGDDGSSPQRLAAGTHPRITPDGQSVLYEAPLSEAQQEEMLRVIPAAGGTPRVLIAKDFSGSVFAISPDSRSLLTTIGDSVSRETLVIVDLASGAERAVAQGYFNGGSWSPDGLMVTYGLSAKQYDGAGDIYVAAAAGGTPVQITSGGAAQSPVWGPVKIAYSRVAKSPHKSDYPKLNLSLMNPDGTGVVSLTNDTVPYLLAGLTPVAFSSDGRRLLSLFGGQDTGYGVRVDAATGAEKILGKKTENGIVGTAISKDGTRVLAQTGGFDPANRSNVVTFFWNGTVPQTLVKNAAEPDWNR